MDNYQFRDWLDAQIVDCEKHYRFVYEQKNAEGMIKAMQELSTFNYIRRKFAKEVLKD